MRARTAQAEAIPADRTDPREDFVPDLSYHASVSLPAGSESLLLSVGGIQTRLAGLTPGQRGALVERFGIFCRDEVSAPAGLPVTRIEVTGSPRRTFLAMRGGGEYYRVDTRWEGEILLACSYEWAGWLDRAQGRGGLSLAEVTRQDARAFDRSLENFLRVLYAHAVVPAGGFLLHDCWLKT